MGQINKIPLGFLNMLGSQTGGKNPFNVNEVVAPTVEMIPFYHAQAMQIMSTNFTPAGNLDSQTIVVPNDESWFVYVINNSELTTLGNDSIRWQIGITAPKSGNTNIPIHTDPVSLGGGAAVTQIASAVRFNPPLPLVAGTIIRQTVVDLVGARNMFLQVYAAVFKS